MVALIHRDTQEGATKYLAEKAVDKETPVFKWAMEAFASIPLMRAVDDEGICHAPTLELKEWGPYCGFRLETDWRSRTRKACDITFRALLILHYANEGV